MRDMIRAAILLAVLPIPVTAFAQEATADSADEYVCVFSGVCADEAEDVSRDAPEVKGFYLGPDKKAAAAAAAVPARKPVAAQSTRPGAAPARPVQVATATTSRPLRTARQEARADLRLTFEKGSAILTADARRKATVFAEALRRPELVSRRFVIEGHTDSEGGRAYNLDLSERRARAVAEFLVSQGVAAERLEVHGFAFDRPLNGYTAAAHQNRRVEAVLIS